MKNWGRDIEQLSQKRFAEDQRAQTYVETNPKAQVFYCIPICAIE